MYKNKGTWMHPGGLIHAGMHGIVTMIILWIYPGSFLLASGLGYMEFVLHYLIDYTKVNINTKMKWSSTTTDKFWYMLGLDQFLHNLTYIGILATIAWKF